ncbi:MULTISPECIES: hypothetical protein [unclassified Rhodococcus (in: high G+C Gram-positive bacteria)]|uniref:hypothetical protein n=1 Tax=unclassified Rhodococcus (in: high G+C Gram-positive bacteria) TaxID=192944 RepID=UPI0020CEFBF5|nr:MULTISPECIES: hypothetical protein [unclassified Rhodococcus (in: high G+C Gram-positive bacteria)]
MNFKIVMVIAALGAVALTACGSNTGPTTSTTTSTIASTTVAPSTAPIPSTTVEPAVAPEPAPVTFECGDLSLYQSGTALYSDGTTGYESSCDTYVPPAPKVLQFCDYPGTAVYTDGTFSTSDPACVNNEPVPSNPNPGGGYPYIAEEDRNGDGVVNGYERCGLACGQEPTSGDLQTESGCEAGYITGPLCDRFGG